MLHSYGSGSDDQRTAFRLARFMARYGAPGAILAFLILRATALAPLALANLKAIKVLPVVLFCCYEVTWLFGWLAGALIIAQYVIHEAAHVSAARALGRSPGWFALIPVAGPFIAADRRAWTSREAEASVALQGQLAGLVAATALLGAGYLFSSPLLQQAALFGFLLNLVQLVPFRLLDGGRLFPGLDWPTSRNPQISARLWLSLAFEAGVRRIACRLGLDRPEQPQPLRTLIGPALFAMLVMGFALVALATLILPPRFAAAAILFWVVGSIALILFVACLDRRTLDSGSDRLLAPRRTVQEPARTDAGAATQWASAATARTALAAYALLLAAHALGAFAAWTV